jgi:hypothetical protein
MRQTTTITGVFGYIQNTGTCSIRIAVYRGYQLPNCTVPMTLAGQTPLLSLPNTGNANGYYPYVPFAGAPDNHMYRMPFQLSGVSTPFTVNNGEYITIAFHTTSDTQTALPFNAQYLPSGTFDFAYSPNSTYNYANSGTYPNGFPATSGGTTGTPTANQLTQTTLSTRVGLELY